jgi:hypothetical protein
MNAHSQAHLDVRGQCDEQLIAEARTRISAVIGHSLVWLVTFVAISLMGCSRTTQNEMRPEWHCLTIVKHIASADRQMS